MAEPQKNYKSKKIKLTMFFILAILLIGAGVWLWQRNKSTPVNTNSTVSTKTSAKDTDSKACNLITTKEASEIMGIEMSKTDNTNTPSQNTSNFCVFRSNDTNDLTKISAITISMQNYPSAATAKEAFNQATQAENNGGEPVGGIGQGAVWQVKSGQLLVVQDSNWIIISAGRAKDTSKEKTIRIAEIVTKRLGQNK